LKKEELADFPQNANPTSGQCHKKKDKKRGLSECYIWPAKLLQKKKVLDSNSQAEYSLNTPKKDILY